MNFDQFEKELERHRAVQSSDGRLDEAALRNSSMELLSRIDHLLNQYDDVPERQKKKTLLGTGRNVLVECLDYVTGVYGAEYVEELLPKVCEIRDSLKSLEKELSGIAWVRSLLTSSTQWDFVDRNYRDVGTEICEVCAQLLKSLNRKSVV